MFDVALHESRRYEGSSSNVEVVAEERNDEQQYNQMQQMILDCAGYGGNENFHESLIVDEDERVVEEEMNPEARKMHEMLETAN